MGERPSILLAALLEEADWTPQNLALASKVSLKAVRRALRGAQASARSRARLVLAINQRRAKQGQPALAASAIFPTG